MDKQEERLRRSHVYLLKHPKTMQLGGIILMGVSSVEDDVPTAYTDGLNKRYGRKFMASLDDAQVNGLVMHENGHVFFRHVTHHKVIFKEDRKLANIAADFVVNDMIVMLKDDHIKLPPGAMWHTMFRNWSVIQVYDYLRKRKKELEQEQPQSGQGNDSQGGETINNPDGQTDVDKLLRNLNDHDSLDEHDIEAGGALDEGEIGNKVDKALREGGLLAGILGGNKSRQIEELLEPRVDWREALREFVTSFCADRDESTWRRPARRWISQDVYMPSSISSKVGRLVVAIDMSGSIGTEDIGQFLGELKCICETVKPEGIDLLYWDTQVCQHEAYDSSAIDGILQSTKPRGGGGTDPRCIPEFIRKHSLKPECAVVLTDGIVSSWGDDWPCPVLWGITTLNITAPVGKSVLVK